MLDNKVFNYVNRLLQDVCSNKLPMGGKTVIVGGDFHQLPPVVENGNRYDQVMASMKSNDLFMNGFTKLK